MSDPIEFVPTKPPVILKGKRLKPELAGLPIAFDMDMLWFIAVKTIEEEAIRPGNVLDRWQSEQPDLV
jgi:hypothetical protein